MEMCPGTERRQVSLRVFNDEPTARMAEQRLQMEGIPCLVKPLHGGPGLWGTAYNLPHDLLVYEENEVRARGILGYVSVDDPDPHEECEKPSYLMSWRIVIVAIVSIMLVTTFVVNTN